MNKIKKALIIMPAYNEEKNIARVIQDIKAGNPSMDILVINDGSGDSTSIISKESGALVINLPFNMGYGVALQTGYKYALENGYEYVVQMDADGQHDPRFIETLLTKVKEGSADVIIGSRFLSSDCYKIPATRAIGMQIFNMICSIILKQRITDSTSGYQAISRDVLKFYADDIYPCDYPDADVLIMLHFAGFKIKEIPVVMRASKSGKSMHGGIKSLYYVFKMLLSILVTLLREKPRKERIER